MLGICKQKIAVRIIIIIKWYKHASCLWTPISNQNKLHLSIGSIRDRIDKESFYLHFIAWALPFVLTISIIVLSEVDGNSITGICFVGYRDRAIRTGLVLIPVGILSFGVSIFFSVKGILNLDHFKRGSSSNQESKKLNSHILGKLEFQNVVRGCNEHWNDLFSLNLNRYGNSYDACGVFSFCIFHDWKLWSA